MTVLKEVFSCLKQLGLDFVWYLSLNLWRHKLLLCSLSAFWSYGACLLIPFDNLWHTCFTEPQGLGNDTNSDSCCRHLDDLASGEGVQGAATIECVAKLVLVALICFKEKGFFLFKRMSFCDMYKFASASYAWTLEQNYAWEVGKESFLNEFVSVLTSNHFHMLSKQASPFINKKVVVFCFSLL